MQDNFLCQKAEFCDHTTDHPLETAKEIWSAMIWVSNWDILFLNLDILKRRKKILPLKKNLL